MDIPEPENDVNSIMKCVDINNSGAIDYTDRFQFEYWELIPV